MSQTVERNSVELNIVTVERRKEYRLNIEMPISVAGTHPQTLEPFRVDTVTKNVSRYGACFELAQGHARVGSILDLSVGKRFEAKCRVIWMNKPLRGVEELGVEFISVTGQWVLYN